MRLTWLVTLFALMTPAVAASQTASVSQHSLDFERAYRGAEPFLVQDIVVSTPGRDGRRTFVLTEPPSVAFRTKDDWVPRVFGEKLVGFAVQEHPIGFDGFARDLVIETGPLAESEVGQLVEETHKVYFGTSYKAAYRPFEPKSWNGIGRASRKVGPPNLEIAAASLNEWLFGANALRFSSDPLDAGTPQTKKAALLNLPLNKHGVYYSDPAGLILLVLPRSEPLNDAIPLLRRFLVDTDALAGAVARESGNWLILVGRERTTPLDQMEPLRTDTVLTLASSGVANLAQSYQRNTPLAGMVTDPSLLAAIQNSQHVEAFASIFGPDGWGMGADHKALVPPLFTGTVLATAVDWAPILLSRELTHTEYGQLLNITDQMLKSWSMANSIAYGRFPYPRPFGNPDAEGVRGRLGHQLAPIKFESLTFNWNTSGFGSWTAFGDVQIFTQFRTGSLPVSYFPDDGSFVIDDISEKTIKQAEDEYWSFFAGLRDPYLERTAEYAALHIIFNAVPIKAARTESMVLEETYLARWNGLVGIVDDALAEMLRHISAGSHPLEKDMQLSSNEFRLVIDSRTNCFVSTSDFLAWNASTGTGEIKTLLQESANAKELGSFLVDSEAATRRFESSVQAEFDRLRERKTKLSVAVDSFNVEVDRCNRNGGCSSFSMDALRKELEEEDTALGHVSEQLKTRAKAVADRNSLASRLSNEINALITPFGNCSAAWKSVVDNVPPLLDAVYRTPGIVVSNDMADISTVGGHNLDGRSVRVLADDAVATGKVEIDGEKGLIRLNPSQMSKAQSVVRSFERDFKRYAVGNPQLRAKLQQRVEAALAQDTRALQAFDTIALKRTGVVIEGERGFLVGPVASRPAQMPIHRAVRPEAVQLNESLAQELARSAEAAGAEGAYRVLPDGLIEVSFPNGIPPVAVRVASRADVPKATELILEHIAKSQVAAKGTVKFVDLSGSISLSDLEAIKYTSLGRPAAGGNGAGIPPTGRGGFLFFGDEPPKRWIPLAKEERGTFKERLVVGFWGRKGKPWVKLSRVDANWGEATIGQVYLETKGNGGSLTTAIEIPFRSVEVGPNSTFAKIVAIFTRRAPTEADASALKEAIKTVALEGDDHTLGMQLELIRLEFQSKIKSSGEDKFLIQIRDSVDDFYVVQNQSGFYRTRNHG